MTACDGREGALRVDLDVVHRLEVELKPLELDDERLGKIAEADPLLRVHLRSGEIRGDQGRSEEIREIMACRTEAAAGR